MKVFKPNPCENNTNENNNLSNDDLADKISSEINDYTSAFNVSITFSITDKIQTYAGFMYKFSFSDGSTTWYGAKFVACWEDPVGIISHKVIVRLRKMGVIQTSGTINITDSDTADYSIDSVTPTNDGYIAKIDVTYNDQTVTVVYIANDLSKPDSDMREAVIMGLVNSGLLTSFDVPVGYEVVE